MSKNKFTSVVDSGKREAFKTGSVRDTRIGKGRYDLLPFSALDRLARHYENGAVKYGDRNWELGQPLGRYIDSAIRHISKWMRGMSDEDHLAAAAWNILGCIHTEEQIQSKKLGKELLQGLPKEVILQFSKQV